MLIGIISDVRSNAESERWPMSSNVKKLCINCGREFVAKKSGHIFCSLECRKRYGNHTGYRCSECRTLPCEHRNVLSNKTPDDCPNYKWSW